MRSLHTCTSSVRINIERNASSACSLAFNTTNVHQRARHWGRRSRYRRRRRPVDPWPCIWGQEFSASNCIPRPRALPAAAYAYMRFSNYYVYVAVTKGPGTTCQVQYKCGVGRLYAGGAGRGIMSSSRALTRVLHARKRQRARDPQA